MRWLFALAILLCPTLALADGVTVTESPTDFTMTSPTVTAKVSKTNGDLTSLTYKGTEVLTDKSGRAGAYWSHDASGGVQTITAITIDPKTNNGERAEVSVKGIAGGKKMGHPAGGRPEGDFPVDIEIRYSLGRDDPGVYTYCVMDHMPEYPAGVIGEAHYCEKLAAMFDWLHVDENRNKYYPREEPGEDKYVYTAVQSENRAYGWSSSTQKMGMFLINPSMEYMGGGPTKVEFLCHRDTTPVQAPCILNYWRSSHYGGAAVAVSAGEKWTKVIGPFMLYVNAGGEPQALYSDARERAKTEMAKWPYEWVAGVPYPTRNGRATVSGQFVLNDPLMPGGARFIGSLSVGLTAAPFTIPSTQPSGDRHIIWQTDAKNYQFWSTSNDPSGKFTIANVRPGKYVLRAYADGVLGEFEQADVIVGDADAGKTLDLGQIQWSPVRKGRELWQVGIANRTAREFAAGKTYFEPDTQIKYATLFPNDVTFRIGQSQEAKDWYFEHIPHNIDPEAQVAPFRGIVSKPGNATPYRIVFDLPQAPKGVATLRLAFCTGSARTLDVSINGQNIGKLEGLNSNADSTIVRHNIQGIWFERELAFPASKMKAGENTLILLIPSGSLNEGVIYDCVRLELDEAATP